MSLDVSAAIRDGLARLPTRVAGILLLAYLAVGASSTITSQTLAFAVLDSLEVPASASGVSQGAVGAGGPMALDLGLPIAIALFLIQILFAQAVAVLGVRTFVSEARNSFPTGLSRRLTWVVLNALVAGFIVNVLVGLGLVLLVVPGIYLAVALYFVQFEVIVEDKNALDAIRDGWALTAGERLAVFLLLVVLFVIGLATAAPAFVLDSVGAPQTVTTAATVALSGVTSVVAVAIGARAYVQLKPDGWSPPGGTPSPFAH